MPGGTQPPRKGKQGVDTPLTLLLGANINNNKDIDRDSYPFLNFANIFFTLPHFFPQLMFVCELFVELCQLFY